VGFAASRILRASSERRYQGSIDGRPSYQRVPLPGPETYEEPLAGGTAGWQTPGRDLEGDLRPQSPSNQPF
jgi:hypothetical protein